MESPTFSPLSTQRQPKRVNYLQALRHLSKTRDQHSNMSLTTDQKKRLRNVAHTLNPVVTVGGNGLSENVQLEVDRALEDHELIKVKFAVGDRDLKRQLIKELVEIVEAQLVQEIGNIAVLFRPAENPNPKLSNLMR